MLAKGNRVAARCTQPTKAAVRAAVPRKIDSGNTSRSVRVASGVAQAPPAQAIALTDNALAHLKKLKADNKDSDSLYLRVGVKSGGCSGMSYQMDFEKAENVKPDDYTLTYDDNNFKIVVDPKSMLFLFGMSMDYSDALIGGGFKFSNPNATDSCGCGKSFGV